MKKELKGVKKVKKAKLYAATLLINEKTFNTEGDTVLEALNQFAKQEEISTLASITVKKGEKSFEMTQTVPKMRNFFNDETYRQILADNFELALS